MKVADPDTSRAIARARAPEAKALNATSVARKAISHATALLVVDTPVAEVVAAMVAEAAVDLATAVRAGPIFNVTAVEGMPLLRLMPFQRVSLRCSRYGHMSRDCTQGSKCYNCKASLLMRPLISG